MKSMTGFGRGCANDAELGLGFRAEISSVNRKQFELKANLPREITHYEPKLRMMVAERASRGALMLRVELEKSEGGEDAPKTSGPIKINETAIAELLAKCEGIKKRFKLKGSLEIAQLLALPGIVEAGTLDFSMPQVESLLCKAVGEAIDNMLKMRELEGENLKADIESRIQTLSDLVESIEPLAKLAPDAQRDRLLQRLRDAGLPAEYDDERLLRELVIFADRADVSEEITRLKSHFIHFKKFLNGQGAPVGRSLDFMIQEIAREATTLGNKTPSPDLSPLVVQFKTELEKIREQVQNIE